MQRSQARGDLSTVIVRPPWFYGPVPARPPDAVLRGDPARALPVHRRRQPAAIDGVHGQPRRRAAARRSACPRPTGARTGSPTPSPYALRDVLQTVRDALAAEGLPASLARSARPAIRRGGRRARRPRAPGHRPLRAGGARARRVEGHDRVRHHARADASSATSRQSACSKGCARASGGAGNGARRSDGSFGAHHGRERVLRHVLAERAVAAG